MVKRYWIIFIILFAALFFIQPACAAESLQVNAPQQINSTPFYAVSWNPHENVDTSSDVAINGMLYSVHLSSAAISDGNSGQDNISVTLTDKTSGESKQYFVNMGEVPAGNYYLLLFIYYNNGNFIFYHGNTQSPTYHLESVVNILNGNTVVAVIGLCITVVIIILISIYIFRGNPDRSPDNAGKKGKKPSEPPLKKTDLRGALVYIVLLFVVSRIVLTIVGFVAKKPGTIDLSAIANIWNAWDSIVYPGIARYGYEGFTAGPSALLCRATGNFAFFPFYPLLIKLLAYVLSDYVLSGMVISNVCLLISCFYLYKIVIQDYDDSVGKRAIKYLFLFPATFVFSSDLSESLFLMLSLICFYNLKRNNWATAGIMGGFAALTRSPGVLLIIPAAYMYYKNNKNKLDINALFLLLIPAGLFVFLLYSQQITGDPLAFIHVQALYSGGGSENPLIQLLLRLIGGFSSPEVLFNALITLCCIVLLVVYNRKIGIEQLVYGLFLIMVPLSSPGSVLSMARYTIVVFPVYIILAVMTKNKEIDDWLTLLLVGLQLLLMASWATTGMYVD